MDEKTYVISEIERLRAENATLAAKAAGPQAKPKVAVDEDQFLRAATTEPPLETGAILQAVVDEIDGDDIVIRFKGGANLQFNQTRNTTEKAKRNVVWRVEGIDPEVDHVKLTVKDQTIPMRYGFMMINMSLRPAKA